MGPVRLRVARHTDDLPAVVAFYRDVVGFCEVGRFEDHDGYDGVILEVPGADTHLEFTTGGGHGAAEPHPENLLVIYFDDVATRDERAERIGQPAVRPANPYWERRALTFEDPDGWQLVLAGPDPDDDVRLLLVTGSTRRGSTNTAALRAVHELLRPAGAETVLYEDIAALPHFDPDADHDPLPAAVAALRAEIARADAVVFCTPEYAGTLPGAFKNLLDWTVGGGEMDRKPVSWINVAPTGRGGGADATLSTVLGYVNSEVLASGGTRVTVPRAAVDDDGTVTDDGVLQELTAAFTAIVAQARAARG
jgi:NAD(P)H-dependent FMN reductase/predicted enzyme related to lactoylglutathione lyase